MSELVRTIQVTIKEFFIACRRARQNPLFSGLVVGSLAIGIGGHIASDAVLGAMFTNPPTVYGDAANLALIWETAPKSAVRQPVASRVFSEWAKAPGPVTAVAAVRTGLAMTLTTNGGSSDVNAQAVTPNVLNVLRVTPLMGRDFAPESDKPGSDQVAVVSYGLWQRQFGAAPDAVGRSIELNGRGYTIVGVLPRGFWFAETNSDVLIPFDPAAIAADIPVIVVARLPAGVDTARVQTALRPLQTAVRVELEGDDGAAWRLRVERFRGLRGFGVVLPPGLVLLNIAGLFVLAVAALNLSTLMAARGLRGRRDVAIRGALGGSRGRLTVQSLHEPVLLALSGGALGLVVGAIAVTLFSRLAGGDIDAAFGPQLQIAQFVRVGVIVVITAAVFGLFPALAAARTNVLAGLKQSSGGSARAPMAWSVLVVAQIALSLILLVSIGLLVDGSRRMQSFDMGFKADNLLVFRLRRSADTTTAASGSQPSRQRRTTYDVPEDVLTRLETVPGVVAAGVSQRNLPPEVGERLSFTVGETSRGDAAQQQTAAVTLVSPGFFRAIGFEWMFGSIEGTARPSRGGLVVLSNAVGRKWWPNRSPLGDTIRFAGEAAPREVVGVVSDVATIGEGRGDAIDYIYAVRQPVEFAEGSSIELQAGVPFFVVRTERPTREVMPALRAVLAEILPNQPIAGVMTQRQRLANMASELRVGAIVGGALVVVALGLSMVGIWAVVTFDVRNRTREWGIRHALGAGRHHLIRNVVFRGVRLSLVGIVLGLVGVIVAERLISSLFFGTASAQVSVLVVSALTICALAAFASWGPGLNAARIAPSHALRVD